MKQSTLSSGFSLVELIVAISIFMILVTIGFVSYSEFNRRQQVTQSGKNIQQIFREAQKKARVGDRPVGCNALRGYRVQSTNQLSLNLIAVCTNANVTVKNIPLINQTRLTANIDIIFNVLAGGVTYSGGLPVTLTVESLSSSNSYEYSFQIDRGGSISYGQLQ